MTSTALPTRDLDDVRPAGRAPHRALRILAGTSGAAVLLALGGLPALLLGWTSTVDGGIHRVHELALGAHMLVLAAGLLALTRRPERRPAAVLTAIAGVAPMVVVSLALGDLATAGLAAAIFAPPLVAIVRLFPGRWRAVVAGRGLSPLLTPVGLLAAAPLAVRAVDLVRAQAAVSPLEPHAAAGHYSGVAICLLAIVLTTAVAASRIRGWTVAAGAAAAAMLVLGIASIAMPDQTSSFGTTGGAVTVAGAVAMAVAAVVERGRLGG